MMSIKTDQSKGKRLESKLKEAGFDIKYRTKDELRLQKCPLHRDKTPSLSINVEKEIFKCPSCGFSGRISKLLKEYGIEYGFYNQAPELSELEALFLESISPKNLITVSGENSAEDDTEKYKANISELNNYRYYHPYLESRGFNKKFIIKNKIGFDKQALRVTIPIFLFGEEYYGCAKRSVINDVPKITYPSGFPKDRLVYAPITNSGNSSRLMIVEGPIDALKASLYKQDAVSIFGCQVSSNQIDIIREISNDREIIVALDNDSPGISGTKKFIQMWGEMHSIKLFNYKDNIKDIGEINIDDFKYGMSNLLDILDIY